MGQEQIEFVIYVDGRVEETTHGVVGEQCEAVTAQIEAALGEIVAREATAERYQQPIATDQAQQTRSEP